MTGKQKVKRPKHHLISVRLPHHLYEQLEEKASELGEISISETIRVLLSSVLEDQQPDKPFQYAIMTHSLIQEAILQLVEDPQSLIDRANAKAEKIITNT